MEQRAEEDDVKFVVNLAGGTIGFLAKHIKISGGSLVKSLVKMAILYNC